jgi:AraC family transcriptional regulator
MSVAETHVAWPPGGAERVSSIREDACAADPAGPPARWVYGKAAIGFVTRGSFEYASGDRAVLAAPGAVILGNAHEEFSVRHVDARGNRRLVVTLADDLLEDVANDAGVAPSFGAIALPPGRTATHLFALMRAIERGDADTLYPLAHAALTADRPSGNEPISPRDRRRVLDAVGHIEANFDQPCPLQSLADIAGISRFRFARMFSSIVGQSPNKYLINTRVRAAADRLATTTTPIAQIAFDVGFNDISHFYACFREAFGCAPRQWRLRG